jgi:hypothetical protein
VDTLVSGDSPLAFDLGITDLLGKGLQFMIARCKFCNFSHHLLCI